MEIVTVNVDGAELHRFHRVYSVYEIAQDIEY